MSTQSTIAAALADLRQKWLACCREIAAGVTALDVLESARPLPVWRLSLSRFEFEELGEPFARLNIAAESYAEFWTATEGVDDEAERAAQLHMLLLPAELRARYRLQSTTYPDGCGYLAPDGLRVTGANLIRTANGASETRAVAITHTIPLELQLERGF